MENLSKHLEILLYIVAFFSGISCMTFVAYFTKGERKKVYVQTIFFLTASFGYLSINFLQFYKEYFFMSVKMNVVLMLLLDVGMAAVVYFWTRLNREIVYPDNTFRRPAVIVVLSVVYVAGWLMVYVFFTDSDYYIYHPFGKGMAVFLDSIFFCGILINLSYYLIKQIKNELPIESKMYITVVHVVLGIYLGWFYLNDLTLIHFTYGAELWDIYPYDPVILFYVLINIATMMFYYKRNELSSLKEKSGEIQIDFYSEACRPILLCEAAKKYDLTKREEEIISLVCRGLSNPEISNCLFISPFTVKKHMQHIFKKMDIKHRTELIYLIKSQ